MSIALQRRVLFAAFVIFVVTASGFALYCAGPLVGNRPRRPVERPLVQLPPLSGLPPPAARYARGTTPQPISEIDQTPRAIDQTPRDVISNREDATDPDIDPNARFSVTRSNGRRL